MSLEQQLIGWTGPSSNSETERQERAERMVREAILAHDAFKGYSLKAYAKGSYRNNTNVRSDSDVDIAVKCNEACYFDVHPGGQAPPSNPYTGIWTPSKLRTELVAAMQAKFPGQVDTSGSTAIHVAANTARVDIDVVPCFDYRYYFSPISSRQGAKVFRKDGQGIVNYSEQQLANGNSKNLATSRRYKGVVRILKRVENALATTGTHPKVASYFVECLVYNVPNALLLRGTWVDAVRGSLNHIWSELEGVEPSAPEGRWLEVNECKYLFASSQPWSRQDGREFAHAAWNYLELGS